MRDEGLQRTAMMREMRSKRASAFRKEIMPYMKYVFQSGFGLLLAIIGFSLLIGYIELLKGVPADWPIGWIGVVLLTLCMAPVHMRTYMHAADTVFVLALQSEVLRVWIAAAQRAAISSSVVRTALLFAVYAPIYARAPATEAVAATHPALMLGTLLALLAGWNAYLGCDERKIAYGQWRLLVKAARWLLNALIVAALLLKPLIYAIPLMIAVMALMLLVGRLPVRQTLSWELLIGEEAAVRRRWNSFLNWFVDVPALEVRVASRKWIAWIADNIAWSQPQAWKYLYAKTFLRSEMFGAYIRWLLLVIFVLIVSSSPLVDVIVYGFAMLVVGLQLSELGRITFVETADTVPVRAETRPAAAAYVMRLAGLFAAILLGLAAASDGVDLPVVLGAVFAVGLLWLGWLSPRKAARSRSETED